MPTRSATLPGRMSLNRPNPLRSTVCGANCHAMAVLGCRIASGRGGENRPLLRPNHLAQRLIHIVGNGIERPGEARHGVMRIQRIRIVGIADAERPGQRARQLPGVLRIKVQIQEIVWLRIGQRKGFRSRRRNSVDELRQGRVGHQRDRAFTEIIIVQAEDPAVGSEAEFVRAYGPGEIVVDEEARGAPSLNPRIVEPSERW